MNGFDSRRVAELLAADRYAESLGIRLVRVGGEEIVVGLDVTESHTNFLGVGHGGAVFSLADCAFSLASNSAGDRAVAIDAHIVLSGGVEPGDRLEATVVEVTRGRKLGTYRADVTRGDGRTVGLFTGTVYISTG